jgi:hypothetical protein
VALLQASAMYGRSTHKNTCIRFCEGVCMPFPPLSPSTIETDIVCFFACRYSKHRMPVVVCVLLLLRLLTASTVQYTPAVSGPTMPLMYRTGIIPLCW